MRRLGLVLIVATTQIAIAGDELMKPGEDPTDAPQDHHADAPSDHHGEIIEIEGRAPKEPEHETLKAEELHVLPGAGNDALRGLQSLPGVARIPFGLGGLALRGAAPHDTRVYLDGIEVPILYHFGGLASFLPIDALEHVELTASGFGARWGRGIGGVVVLDSHAPDHPTHWTTQGEVSLLHAGVLAVGPGPMDGSWLVGFRRSYVDAVLAAAQVDLAIVPSYFDAQLRWESGDKHWLMMAFASSDNLSLAHDPNDASAAGGISATQVKSLDYTSRFIRAGVRYHVDGLTITPSMGFNDIDALANHDDINKGYTRFDVVYALRVDLERAALRGILRYGFDGRATNYDYTITGVAPPSPNMPSDNTVVSREGQRWAADVGLYAEQEWQLAHGRVTVRPGLRFDYFQLADQSVLDPRLSVIEHPGDGVVLTESLGLYHEPPLVTDLDPIFGDRKLAPPQSLQASVAAEAPFFDLFEGKITTYVQEQSNLPVDVVTGATPISDNGSIQAGGLLAISRELVDEQFGSFSYREDIGKGQSWGVELLARREVGNLTGWVSYTYARAFRTGDPLTDPKYYPYVLDQPHVLTAVATLPVGTHWRLGGRFRIASGNPITPVASAYVGQDGKWRAVDGPLLSERLPFFAQLDLRVDRLWRRRSGTWDLYLDVQNVTNRSNAEGVTYSTDFSMRYYTTGLPVFPSIGIEYRPLR